MGLVIVALICAAWVALPLLALLASAVGAQGWATLAALAATVLPGHAGQTLALCLLVAAGVTLLGVSSAVAVTVFDFPSRRIAQWALVLPLAAPGYVLAYAYADFFQPSGSLYRLWQAGMLPRLDIRNLWGAGFVLSACLYPYVYLILRAALLSAGAHAWEAAQSLGAGTAERILRVLLPAARPALAAGVSLALMETLADYGVTSYYGLTTLSTGIYKAWFVLADWAATAQLAAMLLGVVALVLALERYSRRRQHVGGMRQQRPLEPLRLRGARAALAALVAWLPVATGFIVPVLILLKLLWDEGAPQLDRYALWLLNTFKLGAAAACIAFAFAALLAVAARVAPGRGAALAARTVALGYAVPGAVIAVGILLPAVALQQWGIGGAAAAVTGSALGLLYAYVVRFAAAALQPLEAAYAQLSRRVDESAQSLGAGRARIVFAVHAPLLRAPLATAWLLVFIEVMKELPATWLLRPFGYDTLAVVAHQLAKDERLGEAALPSLSIVLLGLLPVMLLLRRGPGTHGA
jgi:iron(III) transport system permease protein